MDNQEDNFYAAFLNIKNRKVLVVGGGNVALRKVKTLIRAGAEVVIISPILCQELEKIHDACLIKWVKEKFTPSHFTADIWLVIAATDKSKVQQEIYREAEKRKIFCNFVDQPEISGFIVPSTVRCGELVVAVSTGGLSPAAAKLAREELEELFDINWEIFLKIAGRLREMTLSSALDQERKRYICSKIGSREMISWIAKRDTESLSHWATELFGNELGAPALEIIEDSINESVKMIR